MDAPDKEKWTVETPAERSCKGKQFLFKCDMRSWHRIFDADGSTVGFAPDIVTARQFAAAPDLLNALTVAVIHLEDIAAGKATKASDYDMAYINAAIAKARPA